MSSELEKSFRGETENVFIFVPNLIGYGRIVLALLSFLFMPTNYTAAAWCYIISGLLDAVDGHAARMLGQSSKFGAMLDMLTDRCATMALLCTLSTFYPSFMFFFQLSMIIDISCHWLHVHTSLLQVKGLTAQNSLTESFSQGSTSHKFIDPTGNYWMKLYYTDRKVLFGMCAGEAVGSVREVVKLNICSTGNELFYAMLYLSYFTSGPFYLFNILATICFPVAVAKSGIALLQGYLAAVNLVGVDVLERQQMKKD